MEKSTYEEILTAIKEKYGSLDEPNWSFVCKALNNNPYSTIVELLETEFEFKDVTEPNSDVSYCYLMEGPTSLIQVELSMVYPCGVALGGPESDTCILTRENTSELERKILDIIVSGGVEMLDQKLLETHVPLKLDYTEPENVCVYQALFSDIDILSWKG